jgi:hypothetical protein
MRTQLWSVNQRATEAEEPPLLRFVTRKHCRGITTESSYQVKTSESRLRRLSVKWFLVWKSAKLLHLFVVTTCKWTTNLLTNLNTVYSHYNAWQYSISNLRVRNVDVTRATQICINNTGWRKLDSNVNACPLYSGGVSTSAGAPTILRMFAFPVSSGTSKQATMLLPTFFIGFHPTIQRYSLIQPINK